MHPKDSHGYLDISEVCLPYLPVGHLTCCICTPKRRAQNVADLRVICCQVGGQMGAEEGGGTLVEVDFFDQF